MRNLDFGFDVITHQERDHERRDGTTQDSAVLRHVLSPDEPANESRE